MKSMTLPPRSSQQIGITVNIAEALDIDHAQNELLCFVGAGGKTTAIFKLAKELKRHGKRILVTTTTAIYYPDEGECDEVIIDSSKDSEIFTSVEEESIIVFARKRSVENKLLGVDKKFIEELYMKKLFNYILVEGDGSKRKPIKAPAFHEPVIPGSTTKAIGVVGLDAIGKRIDSEYVHRPELFSKITKSEMGDIIDEEKIARLIVSKEGLFKAVPEDCQKYLLLNKAENKERQKSAMQIIELVKTSDSSISGFLVSTMADGSINSIK